MENLKNLKQTEQLKQVAKIIKEKSLSLLKKHNAKEDFIQNQININQNVDDYVASLGNIDNIPKSKFYAILLKTCAIFHNAHLNVIYNKELENRRFLSQHLFYINNKVYVVNNGMFLEVNKIGNLSINEVCEKMSEYICYETNEWLSIQLTKNLNKTTLYDILGIDYSIIELKDGQQLNVKTTKNMFDYSMLYPPYETINDKLFSYLILQPDIIRINYRTCNTQLKNEIEKFFNEIKEKIEKENIKHYILDVRGNPGGDSEIILPLLNYLCEKKITGVTLTDNRVFSSGTWAVRYAKEILNTTLIGQPLGQGNIRFGQQSGKIELSDDLIVGYTEKFFDFSNVFKQSGAIKPDIEIPLTIEDIKNKSDRTLSTAIDFIRNKDLFNKNVK